MIIKKYEFFFFFFIEIVSTYNVYSETLLIELIGTHVEERNQIYLNKGNE